MDNPTILVADGDPKNLQILRESLEASGFEVIVASDGLQAWQKISSDVPDLILSEVNLPKLDGFQLLEKLKADPVTSSIPLMFLTNRRELQDRVRSLRGGVKDYMIKPLHVKEVIARVRMILRRMERIREEDLESNRKLAGRLEEFSVIDLIENFGMERKTGILTLYNANNRSGEIYFRDGAVINASLGNLRAEKAVYQMLPWKRGHFTMTFKEINVSDEIAVSNLGLLLQGFKRMEERERLFKMLPSPETTFVTTETFRNIIKKRELTTDVAKFIALIDGKRDILQVIDESTYDDIKTLERLVKLYQQGFIKPSKTTLAGEEELSDIVSSIAEPKIVEQFGLGSHRESPPIARQAPARETSTPKPPEPIRPTPPQTTPTQAFRKSAAPPYVPPERKLKDETVMPHEPQPDFPPPSREPAHDLEPPAAKLPPDMDEDEIDEFGERAIYLEPYGEDAPPEEPPADTIDQSHSVSDKSEYHPPSPIDLSERTKTTGKAPEEAPEPERLPIDLNALMQRPTAPPVQLDKPAESTPAPPPSPTPKVEAKTDKIEPPPPVLKPTETKPSVTAPPPPVLEIIDEFIPLPESETPAEVKREEISEPVFTPVPEAKVGPVDAVPPAPEVVARVTTPLEPPTAPRVVTAPSAPVAPSPVVPPTGAPPQDLVPAPGEPIVPPLAAPPASLVEPPLAQPESKEAPAAISATSDVITACLMKLLKERPVSRPKLVIIGREGLQVSPMLRHLLGSESTLRKLESAAFQYLEIGERKLETQPFEIIGISMEKQFTRLLDTAGTDLIGNIVIVEAYRKEGLEYLSYLLNMLKTVYRQPLGVAVIKSAEQKNMATETLRDLLNIAPTDFVQECTTTDRAAVAEFLKGFTTDANLRHAAPSAEDQARPAK